MTNFRIWFLFTLTLLSISSALCKETEKETSELLFYLTDSQRKYDWKDVKDFFLHDKGQFETEKSTVNLGFRCPNIWIVVPQEEFILQKVLSIQNAFLDTIHVYFLTNEKLNSFRESGDNFNFYTRDLQHNFFNFFIPKDADLIVINVKTSGAMQVPVKIHPITVYLRQMQNYFGLHTMYFGFVIFILVLSFLMLIWLKEKIYLYYILSLLSIGIITAVLFGYAFQYFWPNHPEVNRYSLLFYLTGIFVLIFSEKLLLIKQHNKTLYFIYTGYYVFFALLAIGILVLPFTIANILLFYCCLGIPILCFVSVFFVYKHLEKATVQFYLAGWVIFFLSIFIYILSLSGIVPHSLITSNLIQLGSSVEMVLFSLAILSRIKFFKVEREKMLAEQKKDLEEMVVSRTAKLEEQSREIEEKNRMLEDQQVLLENQVKERTAELEKTNKELVDKNTRLEQFSNVTAHNLRGPVATLLGLCDLYNIQNYTDPINSTVISKTKETTEKIDVILKDLSALLNLDKNIKDLKEYVNLSKVLADVKVLLSTEIGATGAIIKEYMPEPTHIYGVPAYIHNIMYNLLSNAIKFSIPGKQPTIEIIYEKGEFNTITVKDNGTGIDLQKNRDKLFLPYKRFNLERPGKGLGLYMCMVQAEAMGGKIVVSSFPGEGSSFVVRLPDKM